MPDIMLILGWGSLLGNDDLSANQGIQKEGILKTPPRSMFRVAHLFYRDVLTQRGRHLNIYRMARMRTTSNEMMECESASLRLQYLLVPLCPLQFVIWILAAVVSGT